MINFNHDWLGYFRRMRNKPKNISIIRDGNVHAGHYSGQSYNYVCNSSQVGYLVLHGGGWTHGDNDQPNVDDICKDLFAKRDMTVVNLNYPLATKKMHGRKMVNWINDAAIHLSRLMGVKRWILVGTSAGANLGALIVPLHPNLYQEFNGFYGVYNLRKGHQMNPTVNQRKLVFVPRKNYKRYSPTCMPWPKSVPVYLWHGDADTVVNFQQSIDFKNHVNGKLHVLIGKNHGFKVIDYL